MVNKIINGDCLEVLKKIPDNSIDCVCTDPPYGLNFMGHSWDKALPPVGAWEECLRVLKPGGFMFVCSIPRADCLYRMIQNIEDAGFNISFTPLFWSYASGFPKAMNISKVIDKKLGVERTVLGVSDSSRPNSTNDNTELKLGFRGGTAYITEATSEEAKRFDGSYAGYQPKPAVETIIVAMKPLDKKTYVEQALDNQKGITWLDDCRIPLAGIENHATEAKWREGIYSGGYEGGESTTGETKRYNEEGRFPANLIVSDDALNDGVERKSGDNNIRRQEGTFVDHKLGGKDTIQRSYGDSGSFSRFFDLDLWFGDKVNNLPPEIQQTLPFLLVKKPSKSEKNKGLEGGTGSNTYNRKCITCGKWERNQGVDPVKYTCVCETPEWEQPSGNVHPSVKPIQLMSYLITLGSREGDIVLDPFAGSGTTCIAAKIISRNYIGIELSEEYCDIAEKRLTAWEIINKKDEIKGGQLGLW